MFSDVLANFPLRHLITKAEKCWIWTGRVTSKTPVGCIDGKDRSIRLHLRMKAGLPPHNRAGTPLKSNCLNHLCVAPTCSAYADDDSMLFARVRHHLIPASDDKCHNWSGVENNGYAAIRFRGQLLQVIRVILEMHGVKLRRKDQVSHLCENKFCCNIAHLMPATVSINKRYSELQKGPKTRMSIEQAREWHRIEYAKTVSLDWRKSA